MTHPSDTPCFRTMDINDFLKRSVVNFWAADTVCHMLDEAGFTRLHATDSWDIRPGEGYYITQNDSAVFAFVTADTVAGVVPFRIISAHSDSPCFRVKPNAEILSDGRMMKLNTEVYGGPILSTWFDRPLSLAGRVVVRGKDALHPYIRLVKFDLPLMTIPSLAIHYNRQVNDGYAISRQKDMLPIVGRLPENEKPEGWLTRLVAAELGLRIEDILDYDLSVYDTTGPETVGAYDDFITCGRLDDLSMVHAAVTSLINAVNQKRNADFTRVVAIFDNEETGSGTKQGAGSPILDYVLRRINASMKQSEENYMRSIADSFMISADNAHGVHPNYVEKQDPTNHPVLGKGPVIKINANCKYMTDAVSAAIFASICHEAGVPVQYFVNHSDTAGGSTLGNILTSQIPLRGVDMGAAIWAMHSARETASIADHNYVISAFTHFFSRLDNSSSKTL